VRHPGMGSPMLTVNDVARLLSIHINTVRRWTNSGLLKAYYIGPRGDRRFRQEDIARFLAEQSEKPEIAHCVVPSATKFNQKA